MAVYKVLKRFRDIETNEIYKKNDEIEMTVKRGDEAIKNLKKYNGDFLERIDNKDSDDEKGADDDKKTEGTEETGEGEGD